LPAELFNTSAAVEALKLYTPPAQFLLNNFFGLERYFSGRFLTVDTKRQRQVLAPVVSRYHPGVVVKRPAVSTQFYDVPKIAPYRVLTLGELDQRPEGEPPVRNKDAAKNAAAIVVDDLDELGDLILRRTELYASQILTTGKVRYRLDGGDFEEFGYGPGVPTIYNPPKPWTDPTANPLQDLKIVRASIIAATGSAPDILVLSDQAADAMLSNPIVQGQLDHLHMIVGQIQPTRPAGTAQWLGRLLFPALEMWSYSECYIDETDEVTVTPMIPPHCAIVGTSVPSGTAFYGSILQMDDDGFTESAQAKLVPRIITDLKNEDSEIRVQSRPCLVPNDVMSWTLINVTQPPVDYLCKAKNGGPAIEAEESQSQNKFGKKTV
jgi:hypothetical protein